MASNLAWGRQGSGSPAPPPTLVHGQRPRAVGTLGGDGAWFNRLTLTRQFLVASFPILLAGMIAIGILRRARDRAQRRQAHRRGAEPLRGQPGRAAPRTLLASEHLDDARRAELDALFADTPLGQKIVAFVLWRPDGRVLYSNQPGLTGRTFPVEEDLATALRGEVYTHILDRRSSRTSSRSRPGPSG